MDLSHYFALKHHFLEESLFDNNLVGNPDAASVDGFSANQNVTISHVVQNGETYVRTVTNQSTSSQGTWPIGGNIPVTPGADYTYKVRGYRSAGNNIHLYVSSTTNDMVWPGALLPEGTANEAWVENNFTVPTGVTAIRLGVLFRVPITIGTSSYINALILSPSVNNSPIG